MRTGLPPPRWVVSNKKRGAAVVPRSVDAKTSIWFQMCRICVECWCPNSRKQFGFPQDKKLHEYLIAPGVDPGLVVCGTFAQLLAQDELLLD